METSMETKHDIAGKKSKDEILQCMRRWGHASSDALLGSSVEYFTLPNIDGLIGYRKEHECFIAFGDPVCPSKNRTELTLGFHHFAKQMGLNLIYISASKSFVEWSLKNVCQTAIEFGEELTIDPHADPRQKTGVNASLVRRKVRHALNEGVSFHEYTPNNNAIEEAMNQVGLAWLKNRRGPQVFISEVSLFTNRLGKRWFYASQKGKIVGVATLHQLQEKQGWLLNHIMMTPDASHGISELIVVNILELLANEGCNYVTFGSVPARQLGKIYGLGSFSKKLATVIYQVARKYFHLDSRKVFWEKFHPETQPTYLLFSQPRIRIKELFGLVNALNVRL